MGQNQQHAINPMFQDWQQHPTQPNTFINIKQNIQAQCQMTILLKNQQMLIKKRLQENHNFITKILYYEPIDRHKYIGQDNKYFVYVEKTYPVTSNMWIPVTSSLSILKGFRRLSSNYGMMRVYPGMIRVNNKKQIRVWINENPTKSQPMQRTQSQQIMLADIVKFIMQFDHNTGALMVNCQKINDAINNILHNMTQNKAQINLSNRTNKHEDKSKSIVKQIISQQQYKNNNGNNFRSTKQTTQDDQLRPFNDSNNSLKYALKKEININTGNLQNNRNYLQNVVVPKSPTYINVDSRPQIDFNKNTMPTGFRNSSDYDNNSREFNYSQPNNVQKQSSIQFNNSQPTKMVSSGRPYKPVEHKNSNYTDSMKNYSSHSNQINPSYQRINRDPDRYTQKYAELLHNKPIQYSFLPQRKSNLNRNYLQRLENSQQSQMSAQHRNKTTLNLNQKSEINTSREFMQYHSFTRPRNVEPNTYFDSSRTKTQQFYTTSNYENLGCSPRNRTNYLQSNQPPIKTQVAQSNINIPKTNNIPNPNNSPPNKIQIPTLQKYPDFRPPSQKTDSMTSKQKQSHREQYNQQDEKKQIKIKQAQKIKQQMSSLGILGLNKPLTNDKSARDLLIKQKIQEKNKKHEDLKCAITMLLNR